MEAIVPKITDDVANTLFINLLMKCHEHRKPGGFYKDPVACRVVESVDYDFSKFEKGKKMSTSIAMRAKYFDDVTEEFIRDRPEPVVVFAGCGLDARYHRLAPPLTDKAVFYELDLPEVITLRKQLLPPGDNDILLPGSVFDTEWMDTLKKAHPTADFLFTLEGVVIYFDNQEVGRMMRNLAQRFAGGKVLFDAVSSWLCRNQDRMGLTKTTKSPMKLALDDEREVEAWADNLRLESCRFYSDFKEFRHAPFAMRTMIKLVPVFRKSSKIISCAID